MTYATMTPLKSRSRRADTCYHRAVCSDILHKVHYHFGIGMFGRVRSYTATTTLFDELSRPFPTIKDLFLRNRKPERLIPVRTSQSKLASAGANVRKTTHSNCPSLPTSSNSCGLGSFFQGGNTHPLSLALSKRMISSLVESLRFDIGSFSERFPA